MKTKTPEPITIKEAAERLGITCQHLYDSLRCQRIQSRRLGRERYFLPEDMAALKKHFEERGKE